MVDTQVREEEEEVTLGASEREAVARFVERLRRGDKMIDIFGVDEDTMGDMESQAYRLYRNNRYGQAKVACRGVLALDEDRPLMLLLMGDMALDEYRFLSAVEHLHKAHVLVPDHVVIRARLGEALMKAGQADAACEHLEAVVEEDSGASEVERKRCGALLSAIK